MTTPIVEALPADTPPPVEAPSEATPATEEAPDAKPLGKREARQGTRELARHVVEGLASEPSTDEVVPGIVPVVEQPPVETPPEGEVPLEGGSIPVETPVEIPAAAATRVVISVPEDHPIYTQNGQKTITAKDPQEERVIRAMLNSYTRRDEITTERAKRHAAEEEILRYKTRQAASQKFTDTPEYKQSQERYAEIKETIGDEAADEYWQGQQLRFQEMEKAEFATARAELDEQHAQEGAERWVAEARHQAGDGLPKAITSLPVFETLFNQAIEAFNHELIQGTYPKGMNQEQGYVAWKQFFAKRLSTDTDVRAVLDQGRAANEGADKTALSNLDVEKIRRDAVEKFKQDAADKRRDVPPHALGNLAAQSTSRTPVVEKGEPSHSAPQTPSELKRASRLASRVAARKHFAQE